MFPNGGTFSNPKQLSEIASDLTLLKIVQGDERSTQNGAKTIPEKTRQAQMKRGLGCDKNWEIFVWWEEGGDLSKWENKDRA